MNRVIIKFSGGPLHGQSKECDLDTIGPHYRHFKKNDDGIFEHWYWWDELDWDQDPKILTAEYIPEATRLTWIGK